MMYVTELERFIQEDTDGMDASTSFLPPVIVNAQIIVKEYGIIAGMEEAVFIFDYFNITSETAFKDGDIVSNADIIFKLKGNAAAVLQCERLVLNIIGRMSGIATSTRRCVSIARNVCKDMRIAATRKTVPGFRKYEKKAVQIGGGDPHRFNQSDCIMIKDNHLAIMGMGMGIGGGASEEMGIKNAIKAAKRESFTKKIEVEVGTVEDAITAIHSGADIIMFDNLTPAEAAKHIEKLVDLGLRDKAIVELSGGINESNISDYAGCGADVISMGSLIHSSRFLDVSLKIIR